MTGKFHGIVHPTTDVLVFGTVVPGVAAEQAVDKALELLESYDWGRDRSALAAIDRAIPASHNDVAAQKQLETRLTAVLRSDVSDAAKDYVCRKLSLIGSASCVPTLATLLTNEKLSHMARYALERIPSGAAVKALRDALPEVRGLEKVGVINSLGVRRDAEAVPMLIESLSDSDGQIAAAAIWALGSIGNARAAKALATFQAKAPRPLQPVVADARLACAERLVAAKEKRAAMAIYRSLAKPEQPKHIQQAAKRGLLTAVKQ